MAEGKGGEEPPAASLIAGMDMGQKAWVGGRRSKQAPSTKERRGPKAW